MKIYPKNLIILRGISGSGKSTFSEEMIKQRKETKVHSTDNFFINQNGEYVFNPKKLGEYHAKNLQKTIESIKNQIWFIIVDNTNLLTPHFNPYISAWKHHNYHVSGVQFIPRDVSAHTKDNTHNVPPFAIEQMIKNFYNAEDMENFTKMCDTVYAVSPENFSKNIQDIIAQILKK